MDFEKNEGFVMDILTCDSHLFDFFGTLNPPRRIADFGGFKLIFFRLCGLDTRWRDADFLEGVEKGTRIERIEQTETDLFWFVKYTSDLYLKLKFNLTVNEKLIRLNQFNLLYLRSFLTYLPYNHLSYNLFF